MVTELEHTFRSAYVVKIYDFDLQVPKRHRTHLRHLNQSRNPENTPSGVKRAPRPRVPMRMSTTSCQTPSIRPRPRISIAPGCVSMPSSISWPTEFHALGFCVP